MKLFGEYLVEQNIVTEEALAEALISQIKGIPSIAEIVYEEKLLPAKDFVKVMSHQIKEGLEFRRACQELKLWNQEIERQIKRRVDKLRKPLGQILADSGKIEFSKMIHALDDFLSDITEIKEAAIKNSSEVNEQTQRTSAPPLQSTQDLPEATTNTFVGPSLITNSEKTAIEIELGEIKRMDLIEDNYKGFIKIFSTLHKFFHKIRGSARLQGAEKLEKIIKVIENRLEVAEESFESGCPVDTQQFIFAIEQGLDLIEQISATIAKTGQESTFFATPDNSKNYENKLQEITNLQGNSAAPGGPR